MAEKSACSRTEGRCGADLGSSAGLWRARLPQLHLSYSYWVLLGQHHLGSSAESLHRTPVQKPLSVMDGGADSPIASGW